QQLTTGHQRHERVDDRRRRWKKPSVQELGADQYLPHDQQQDGRANRENLLLQAAPPRDDDLLRNGWFGAHVGRDGGHAAPSSCLARMTSSRRSSQTWYASCPNCGDAFSRYTSRGRGKLTLISALMRPGWAVITSTRSLSTSASSMLCVMNSTVLRVSSQM